MKVLFKNTTKYDKENCNNFINFHNNKYGKKELVQTILIIAFFIYVIAFNIVYKNWLVIIFISVIAILLYFINKYKNEKKNKKNKQEKIKEFTFYFYEKYIKIKYKRQFERVRYLEIKKVFETNENFFFVYG